MSDHDDLPADGLVAEGDASSDLGQRLRRVRRAQGMSLADVEARSGGRWSASAVGAYERGFRNLSIPRLKSLADFYSVPIEVLLGDDTSVGRGQGPGLVLDLERLRTDMAGSPLERFADAICRARGDYNGRVLSIRADDLQAVCAMVGGDPGQVIDRLQSSGVLIAPGEIVDRVDDRPPLQRTGAAG